jgi:hypothetical protein
MTERILLRAQINDVLMTIKELGLKPEDFRWAKEKSYRVEGLKVWKIVHLPTGYYFIFDFSNELAWPRYSVMFPNKEGSIFADTHSAWTTQLILFRSWVTIVKNDIDIPDPWDIFSDKEGVFETSFEIESGNELFNQEEQNAISEKLQEIRDKFRGNKDINAEHMKIIEDRLQYLDEASKRLGRKDWLNAAIGVSFGVVTQMGISSHLAQEIFKFLVGTFANILGGPILIP